MRRIGLILFGALFALLFLGVALGVGVGSSSPRLPPRAVAVVEGVPADLGIITRAGLEQEMLQRVSFLGAKRAPRPGDEDYEDVRNQALSNLILIAWLQGQAEEMGIEITERQIANTLPKSEEARLMKEGNYTQKGFDLRIRKEVLVSAIQESLAKAVRRELGAKPNPALLEALQQEAFREFDVEFRQRWQPRTFCADSVVIDQCGNYPPFGRSYMYPRACAEADPKEVPAEGCPAPVPQNAPAVPGSVTVLKPEGEPKAQRPFPEAIPEGESAGGWDAARRPAA